jgi:hypothetical protein
VALLFMDGFDKYGPVNNNNAAVAALLQQGEWNSTANVCQIAAPLSATGQAVNFLSNATASKTLATNYGRIIGGFRFASTLATSMGIQFIDGVTAQSGINIASTGAIQLRNGNFSTGTLIGSGGAITANSAHYLEWDITFGNSAAYQVWLDGISLFSGTGDTTATANNTISGFILGGSASTNLTVDDLYIFDSTGTVNNAPLLTSPRIETTFPSSDNSVQFAVGAATLGSAVSRSSVNFNSSANQLYLRPYTPTRACTLNSIVLLPASSSGTINSRPVVYADNAGSPTGGALLSAGSTVTGMTNGAFLTLPLTTPQSLTAGTQYWFGFMSDLSGSPLLSGGDATNSGRTAVVTFSSGAPGTAPAMSTGAVSAVVFGNITLASPVNYYEVASQPAQGLQSYVTDTTVADEDLYNFPALSQLPSTVHAVAVKANCSRSDTGARTVSMRMRSGGTDSGGSLTGQTPPASSSFGWLTSLFLTDPNTGAGWLGTALNAAQSGFRIDT